MPSPATPVRLKSLSLARAHGQPSGVACRHCGATNPCRKLSHPPCLAWRHTLSWRSVCALRPTGRVEDGELQTAGGPAANAGLDDPTAVEDAEVQPGSAADGEEMDLDAADVVRAVLSCRASPAASHLPRLTDCASPAVPPSSLLPVATPLCRNSLSLPTLRQLTCCPAPSQEPSFNLHDFEDDCVQLIHDYLVKFHRYGATSNDAAFS